MKFVEPAAQTESARQSIEVDKNQKLVQPESCPFLGLLGDRDVRYGFPSPANLCFRGRLRTSPAITHQDAYCLSGVHDYCPVYLQEVDQAPSSGAPGRTGLFGLRLSPLALVVLLLLILLLAGLIAYEFSPGVRDWFAGLPVQGLWRQAASIIGTRLGVAPAP